MSVRKCFIGLECTETSLPGFDELGSEETWLKARDCPPWGFLCPESLNFHQGKNMAVKISRKEKWHRKLNEYASRMNRKPPQSEVWFWKEWKAIGMNFRDEIRNAVFAGTIPDVRSKRFRYIIEIDGSVHAKPEVMENDARKSAKWRKLGYQVFRIMAGDREKLKEVAHKVRKIREECPPLSDALMRIYDL